MPSSHAARHPRIIRACLVFALTFAGPGEEARVAANGLIEAAEATRNPHALSYALNAYGFAFRDTDPDRALDAFRRGLVIAQDSGNRCSELAAAVWPASKPDTVTLRPHSITSLWQSATTTTRAAPA